MRQDKKHIIAVMQPTYLPWIGYFDLIDQVDHFVLLDDVEFTKQSWQQRNRIKTANGIQWLTIPVLWRERSGQRILEVEINPTTKVGEKHLKTIKQSYSKASFFKSYIDELSDLLLKPRQLLGVLNMDLIKWFCQKLGINTKLIRSSELRAEGAKVSRLINICRAIKANSYLSTLGAKDYIDENNLFNDYGIELCYQNYSHPQYKQIYGDFIPYMSIIDLLLNEGNASLEIIRSGQRENIKGT